MTKSKVLCISNGNSKIGNISNFSLPPMASCPKVCLSTCCINKSCYAMKFYKMYPNVRKAWDKNFEVSQNSLKSFSENMMEYLSTYKKPYFRIHVSGDFFSKDYFVAWCEIIKQFPNIRFLAYTKCYDLLSEDRPSNLQLIGSLWNNVPSEVIPQNTAIAYVNDGMENRHTKAFKCPSDCSSCKVCYHLDELKTNVYFDIH
jgi:hypothetical protein